MSIKTQKTEIFTVNPTGLALVKLACPTGASGLGGPSDQIDITCLDADTRGFAQGLKNPGQISVPFNFDPQETSHDLIIDLYEAGTTTQWMIALSDGTTQPTVDSAGDFVSLTSRSNFVFDAYIADLTIDIATNEVVRGTISLQRSGAYVFTKKV